MLNNKNAIEQGSNSYTVLQMASYVATKASGVFRKNVSVIRVIKTTIVREVIGEYLKIKGIK